MTIEDIHKILSEGEGLKIEFKKAINSVPGSLYETVVSFSNTDGGTIVLGAENDGTVIGIESGATGQMQTDIVTALNSIDCISPPIFLQPEIHKHPGGILLVLQIPVSSQVHEHAGKTYIRESDADIDVTGNQSVIADLYHRKRTFFSEGEIYDHLAMSDLDEGLFDKARTLIRNYRSDHPWLLSDNLQMLKDSILWKKDFATGKEGFTLAAALIFGKDQTIQSILPAYKVEAIVRIKNKDRWDDRIALRTNLIDTYLQLKDFINKHLPEKFFIEGDQRIDLRDKIFREVIGNVIVHREYANALSTDLIITEHEVTFTNPNKPLFLGPMDPSSFNPFAKNPNIRKYFTAFGWADEIGSGIRNTYKYLPLYAPKLEPVFIENDIFKTEIPLQRNSLDAYSESFQQWLELPESAVEHIASGLSSISLSTDLIDGSWDEILPHLVSSWHRKGTQLNQLKWPGKQPFIPGKKKKVPDPDQKGTQLDIKNNTYYQAVTKEMIKKVPSWNKKGTKLIAKRSLYLVSVLFLASEPIKREEMMAYIGYANKKSFFDLYLIPLLQEQLIKRTNEDNLNAPNQQYYLTETGKHFLGGTLL